MSNTELIIRIKLVLILCVPSQEWALPSYIACQTRKLVVSLYTLMLDSDHSLDFTSKTAVLNQASFTPQGTFLVDTIGI